MNKNTPIIIIGFGSIGKRHTKNLRELGFMNIAVHDPNSDAIEGFQGEVISLLDAKSLSRFRIAFITNPTHLHVTTALLAAKAGCHLFVEKPVSHTLAGVEKLRKLCRDKRLVNMVACNFRFHSGFQRLKRVLDEHTLGAPLLARVTVGYYLPTARKASSYKALYAARKKMGGGVVLDSGSHVVDYLSVLFGKVESRRVFKSPLHSLGIQSEEAAVLIIKHKSGVLSTAALDYVSRNPTHRVEIVTDKGVLTLDLKKDCLTFEDGMFIKTIYKGGGDANAMYLAELKHFLRCVKDGSASKQDIAMGKETLRTLLTT